ncbi:transglycosylase SLT domain-containing protein [Solitalea sp. MAHUQ-68]|uniref:Transglycosylase SLT domain-containing protein n=1 Tax=Solitalea agri TaxID=2953739 RepID=A0A9X2JDG0_9SPHI|nr:transglycosylase SLT domain-containing protein [Solitalea agri]MCO4294427.1 transglycosylase SLT domain-containing protein [Solitalea agri]
MQLLVFSMLPVFFLTSQLIKNIAKLFSLPACKIFTIDLCGVRILLLLILVISSCNREANKAEKKTVSDVKSEPIDSALAVIRQVQKVYTGDFDMMKKHRIIRVLVPYSRTLFFNDKGQESGITADNFRQFEQFINRKYRKQGDDVPFTVVFYPTPRDQLIEHLVQGLGDIAAGNLTATENRLLQVDFMAPKEQGSVTEIVLTRKQDKPLMTVEQLSGMTIYVRKSSSYYESLQLLNKTFRLKGKAPVVLKLVSEDLEDEDLMEMLDAGIIPAIVVDDWMAEMWVQVLPNIRLNKHAAVRTNAYIGCAYRKNSPLLTAELKDFYYNFERRMGNMPYRLKKYYSKVKHLQDPTNSGNTKRYSEIMTLFEKYGKQYEFDPLMLAAIGFQESALDQSERSPAGAVGVMQLMPATGASMKVGSIYITEHNIHAATKYMNILMTKYFKDARFDEVNRSLFAFASYNAGPYRIADLRKIAIERGLNPNVWLNNVEIIASEKIGLETTTYVRNVLKYYCSYKLMQARREEVHEQKKELVEGVK